MDTGTAKLLEEGGKILSELLRAAVRRPDTFSPQKDEDHVLTPSMSVAKTSTGVALPTSDETTEELKRRLAKELYRMELDLAAGLKIAGKPCDCGSNKHTLMLEAAAEELVSQDPGNASVYQDIIKWIPQNRVKITPEAIGSGKFTSEYPHMANEFKEFRKRVFGSTGEPEKVENKMTLEQAKRMAAEEAVKEVERAWQMEE